MFDFLKSTVPYLTPLFVVSTMLNVGLTEKLSDIIEHLKNLPFVFKMLLANFVLAPSFMVLMLHFAALEPDLEAGLLIFSLCAGAAFLIKLTQAAEHEVSLGAALMTLLMAVTVIYVPIALPLFLSGLQVNAGAIATTLVLQLLLPIALGMLFVQLDPESATKLRPAISRLSNVALNTLIAATLIGYFPNMLAITGTGAVLVGLLYVLVAFVTGYLMGAGKDHLQNVGGLATAQRNTAAAMIIAVQNFRNYPDVLVIITIVNTLGIVMLTFIAKRLSRTSKVLDAA